MNFLLAIFGYIASCLTGSRVRVVTKINSHGELGVEYRFPVGPSRYIRGMGGVIYDVNQSKNARQVSMMRNLRRYIIQQRRIRVLGILVVALLLLSLFLL